LKKLDTPRKYKYRPEIDGLRAIAVLPVIFFHFGIMPNGYLGVDVFFVISGYLITGIIYKQILNNSFSIKNFYIKRTRRILPLVSFICLIALIIGVFTMLPDDLENLSQSIIATNFFSNNILQILTTKNYWDVVNEFKPLMHTWSLAIEEQYYLFYPFLFLLIGKKRISWLLPILVTSTIISIILYFSDFPEYQKFYLLQYRFFELSIGGIAAIVFFGKTIKHSFNWLVIISLCSLLVVNFDFLSDSIKLLLSVILTVLVLISNNSNRKISKILLENNVFILIGKISFSLYMWHQIVLAFARYFVFKELNAINLSIAFIITFALSYLSYKFIETPFRHSKQFSNKMVLSTKLLITILTTTSSIYIY
jgi:peptidoglycan/LPS O-acetylase OafA/YrhL